MAGKIKISDAVVYFYLDSELVVKQINGLYKVKDAHLKTLSAKVKSKIELLNIKLLFNNIRREKNTLADSLVNRELDAKKPVG
jgi:ribonuclease HI